MTEAFIREGKGKCYFADGNVYDGAWLNDQLNGEGKMEYSFNYLYHGMWFEGKKHGYGNYEQ